MAKKNKTKKTTSSKTKPTNEGILAYLRRIFTWQSVMGIITVLSFGYFIYDRYIKPSEVDILKNEISSEIAKIENTFNSYSQYNDSVDSLLIEDYKKTALNLCALWRSIEETGPFSEFNGHNEKEIVNILNSSMLLSK